MVVVVMMIHDKGAQALTKIIMTITTATISAAGAVGSSAGA